MAEIKGIAHGENHIEFLTPNTIEINGNRYLTKNLIVKGEIIQNKPLEIVSFADGTDEQIAKMLEAHYNGEIDVAEYWHVGDERKVHFNGIASPNTTQYTTAWPEQDITLVIIDFNHHDLSQSIGDKTKAAVTVQTKECLNNLTSDSHTDGTIYLNFTGEYNFTYNKWSELPIRTWMNDAFLTTCIPTELQNLIKATNHRRLTINTGSTTERVTDKIFLPSYPEIFGNVAWYEYLNNSTPSSEEGTQLEYYKTETNRIKYGNNNGVSNGTAVGWWNGSLSSDYSDSGGFRWCFVSKNGSQDWASYYMPCAFAPAFCL